MSDGSVPCPWCEQPEDLAVAMDRMGRIRDDLIARGVERPGRREMADEAERLRALWGPTAPWRDRALRAEAEVRALREAQGELLMILGYAPTDPREMFV